MKDLLQSLWKQLLATNVPTRIVLGAGLLLVLAVGLFSTYKARNPNMVFFRSDLDPTEFSQVTAALGQAGIRFETSSGRAPYSIWIEDGKKHQAWNALALQGALDSGPRGIDTSGSTSAFDASIERQQKANARFWQEVAKQLELLSWVSGAHVTASVPTRTVLGRLPDPTVSVVLTVRGGVRPTLAQSQAVASIVRNAFGVPDQNVSISDQNGLPIFDGSRDDALDAVLEFEERFNARETERAQAWLDRTYGPGMAVVGVRGEWSHERIESVDENIDPSQKLIVSDESQESVEPVPASLGGPAGVAANLQPPAAAAGAEPTTRTETNRTYAYGSKTTHSVRTEPRLTRLSVSLLLDASRSDELEGARETVQALVGFDEARGDSFSARTTQLYGVERDDQGQPLPPVALEAPSAPSATTSMLVEWGLEALAAIAFLLVLGRSLRKSRTPAEQRVLALKDEVEAERQAVVQAAIEPEQEELDPDVLARMHVEQLIDEEPERVSALLSRWAMGEGYYEKAKA